jgi:hypothetical protein
VLVLDRLGSPVAYSDEQQLLWKPSANCALELKLLGLWEMHQPFRIRGQTMQDASLMLVGLRHVVPTLVCGARSHQSCLGVAGYPRSGTCTTTHCS